MKLKSIIFVLTAFSSFYCSSEVAIHDAGCHDQGKERIETVRHINIQNIAVAVSPYVKSCVKSLLGPSVQKGYDLFKAKIPESGIGFYLAHGVNRCVNSVWNLYGILTDNARYSTLILNTTSSIAKLYNGKSWVKQSLSVVGSTILPSVLYFTNNSKYLGIYDTAAAFYNKAQDYSYQSAMKFGWAFLLTKAFSVYMCGVDNFSISDLAFFGTSFVGTTTLYNMWKMCFDNFVYKETVKNDDGKEDKNVVKEEDVKKNEEIAEKNQDNKDEIVKKCDDTKESETIKEDSSKKNENVIKQDNSDELWYDINTLSFLGNTILYNIKFFNLGLLNGDVVSAIALLSSWDFIARPLTLKFCDWMSNATKNTAIYVSKIVLQLQKEGLIHYMVSPYTWRFLLNRAKYSYDIISKVFNEWPRKITSFPNVKDVEPVM